MIVQPLGQGPGGFPGPDTNRGEHIDQLTQMCVTQIVIALQQRLGQSPAGHILAQGQSHRWAGRFANRVNRHPAHGEVGGKVGEQKPRPPQLLA